MEIDEFVDVISSNVDIMVKLFDTRNIENGIDLYNVCYFCGYETRPVPLYDDIDEADDDIIKHIYSKHYEKAREAIDEFKLKKAANVKGQSKLEVEDERHE